jgi:hypothetical protein
VARKVFFDLAKTQNVRFGDGLIGRVATFDIDASDERGIFLAGFLDAEIREFRANDRSHSSMPVWPRLIS